ncbi:hypothetical protein LXA43DRAFT_1065138 [Ganoderma leucocontextum]|nr:hypothetical protein LXA43DRAFT_1065138 [Ganoderma leucocontextum]
MTEPVYRLAEHFTDVLSIGIDSQISHLPPKDVNHRVYCDIRFSKPGFLPVSRGADAGKAYSLHTKTPTPYIDSLLNATDRLACGGLTTDQPHPKEWRCQNIFGAEDGFRMESKGIGTTRKCIEITVYFMGWGKIDERKGHRHSQVRLVRHCLEVLSPDFKDKLARIAKVIQPFGRGGRLRNATVSPAYPPVVCSTYSSPRVPHAQRPLRSSVVSMRLLDTETGQFVEKDPRTTVYAILSHTWDKKGEQTYEQLKNIQRRYDDPESQAPESRPGSRESGISSSPGPPQLPRNSPSATRFPPIPPGVSTTSWFRANGYRYIWIDSCCIDKSSSSELSEAINSMYAWYARADVCYAYLADVPPGDDHQAEGSRFRKSRWFTRGWTLQELIAPVKVDFLSKDWAPIGSKHALVDLVESVADINYKALLKLEPLDAFSVAQRFSWAAKRETTREEDRAYSLLGIFDINMPTLYGEGDRAFRRLQEQIMQRIPDQSLFAWGEVYLGPHLPRDPDLTDVPSILHTGTWGSNRSPIAKFPDTFNDSGTDFPGHIHRIQFPASHRHETEYTSTPYGIRTQFQMIPLTRDLFQGEILPRGSEVEFDPPEDCRWYLAILGCEHADRPGHLLGRVCYTLPSETDVEFVYAGWIGIYSTRGDNEPEDRPELFPLSPEAIEHCRPLTKLKTVYVSHPDRADRPSILRLLPYTAIKLVLLRETRDTLRSRGYSADLRDPDPDHPTGTHWLTLSRDEHTITVEFRHTLKDGGKQFTMNAKVKLSASHVQLDSTPDSDQVDLSNVSWTDRAPFPWGWSSRLGNKRFVLTATGVGTLDVDLVLEFAGNGFYILRVDVLRDAPPPPSAVEPVVGKTSEVESTEDNSPSGVVDTEDEAGWEEEADGRETASVETRALRTIGDEAGDHAYWQRNVEEYSVD